MGTTRSHAGSLAFHADRSWPRQWHAACSEARVLTHFRAGNAAAPARIAAMLGVEPGSELASRRLLIRHDGQASEILTWWLSPGLAGRTGLDHPVPVRGGMRSLLARTADIRIDHILEQVAARRPEPHEAKLLGVTRSAPVLALYISARDASGQTVLALDLAMPGDLHELEDAYAVT